MRRLLALAFAALVVAGCAQAPATQSTVSPTPTYEQAQPDAETGAIEGRVADDEARPLGQADVSISPTGLVTKTDDAGRFSVSDLQAGSYVIAIARLGYESAARRVEVRVGEVAWANVTLVPIAIAEARVEVRTLDGYIKLGNAATDIFTAGNAYGCEKCRFNFTFDGAISEAGMLEPLFTSSLPPPHDAMRLGFQGGFQGVLCVGDAVYSVPPDNDGYWASRQKINADKCKFGEKKGTFYLFAYCDWDWVCFEQRFKVYVSIFHGMLPAEEYSALPPP